MRAIVPFLISMILGAQAPTSDSSFYAVVYLEVQPASQPAAMAAFKQYQETSRKDDGFVRFELFEQAGWPGHLVLIETWANQKAFETHAAAAHSQEWRTKVDPIRVSDYDQRPYKTLSLGTTPVAANNRATYVIAHVDIGGQGTNASELLKRVAEASRKENGNLRFDVLQHNVRANHFTVIEAWESARALDAHAAAAHTRQYRDGIGPIAGSPLDQRMYKIAQ